MAVAQGQVLGISAGAALRSVGQPVGDVQDRVAQGLTTQRTPLIGSNISIGHAMACTAAAARNLEVAEHPRLFAALNPKLSVTPARNQVAGTPSPAQVASTSNSLPLTRRSRALLRQPITQFRTGIELPPDLSIVDSPRTDLTNAVNQLPRRRD